MENIYCGASWRTSVFQSAWELTIFEEDMSQSPLHTENTIWHISISACGHRTRGQVPCPFKSGTRNLSPCPGSATIPPSILQEAIRKPTASERTKCWQASHPDNVPSVNPHYGRTARTSSPSCRSHTPRQQSYGTDNSKEAYPPTCFGYIHLLVWSGNRPSHSSLKMT